MSGKIVAGLKAKGEDFGLMRKMMNKWFDHYFVQWELTALGIEEIRARRLNGEL